MLSCGSLKASMTTSCTGRNHPQKSSQEPSLTCYDRLLNVSRGVNSFTLRLLKRKRAFIQKRIQTIQDLSRDVQSCSLDSKCTFMLKSSAELDGLKEQVNQTLDEVFVRGALNTHMSSVRHLQRAASSVVGKTIIGIESHSSLYCSEQAHETMCLFAVLQCWSAPVASLHRGKSCTFHRAQTQVHV